MSQEIQTTLSILDFFVSLFRVGLDALRAKDPAELRRVTDLFPEGSVSKTEAENVRRRAEYESKLDGRS